MVVCDRCRSEGLVMTYIFGLCIKDRDKAIPESGSGSYEIDLCQKCREEIKEHYIGKMQYMLRVPNSYELKYKEKK